MAANSNDGRLAALNDLAGGRLPELVEALGLDLKDAGKQWGGTCPVHGGDNETAFKLYGNNHTEARWVCSTRHCETKYIGDVVGLVRGVLSYKAGQDVGLVQARDWLCDWLKVKWRDLKRDEGLAEKRKFVQQVAMMAAGASAPDKGWTRDQVRSRLRRPSTYFLGLGFSPELLDRFDAGDSQVQNPHHPMYGRACLPVYDPSGQWCLGATGRWPTKEVPDGVKKWRHTEGLSTGRLLYGLWLAAPAIRRTGRVVLVESPLDAIACFGAGVQETVALLGTNLSDAQQALIERMSCYTVLIALDPDGAGEAASRAITAKLARLFRVRTVSLSADPSDCEAKELQAKLRDN